MPITVNGEYVQDTEIRQEANLIRVRLSEEQAPGESSLAIQLRAYECATENIIDRVLLRQEALKDGDPIQPGVLEETIREVQSQLPGRSGCILPGAEQEFRKQVEVNLRIERFIAKLTAKVSRPKNKEVADYYHRYRKTFHVPELVHAAHIVKNVGDGIDEQVALSVITTANSELQTGRSFEEVADEYSDCPGRGGDLGFFPQGQMVNEFEEVVFALKPGQVSKIFRSPFGFHIAKLYERNAAGPRLLNEVRREIEQTLYRQREAQVVEHFVDRLRAQAEIRKVRDRTNKEIPL